LGPSSSAAIFKTNVESTPPEKATSADPMFRIDARIDSSFEADALQSAST
jgi:hypothetical protein